MKYIKTYESVEEPEIGDYVMCDESDYFGSNSDEIGEYLKNNIGQYIKDNPRYPEDSPYKYIIKYPNSPSFFLNNTREMNLKQIIRWSPNKEDLEPYIIANKYNL